MLKRVFQKFLPLLFAGMTGSVQNYSFCPLYAQATERQYGNTQNIVFRVQLFRSSQPVFLAPDNFNGLENVEEYYEDGVYYYLSGYSEDYDYARDVLLNQVRRRGYIEAEVLAFKFGDRLPLHEALKLIEKGGM